MDPWVVREARAVLARAVQCYEAATSSAEAEMALLSELKAVHSRSISNNTTGGGYIHKASSASKGGKHD